MYLKGATRRAVYPISAEEKKLQRLDNQFPGATPVSGSFRAGKFRKLLAAIRRRIALKAYEDRSAVTCSGDLIKENDGFVLKKPRDFVILTEAELIE